jgi:hypothetical protein
MDLLLQLPPQVREKLDFGVSGGTSAQAKNTVAPKPTKPEHLLWPLRGPCLRDGSLQTSPPWKVKSPKESS